MTSEDYPLTVEILVDGPCDALLKKGQICKAKYNPEYEMDFLIFDSEDPDMHPGHWKIEGHEAKVIKNG